jgi:murein DD-endopeptidase MepM/ murein hydrolase activator NlpD
MNEHSFSEKLLRFLNGKGFYIALVLCLAALGGSGWFLWQEFHTARDLAAQVNQVQSVTVDSADTSVDPEPEPEPQELPSPAPVQETAAPLLLPEEEEEAEEPEEDEDEADGEVLTEPEETDVLSPVEELPADDEAVASAAWVWPLEGQVVSAFSADSLSYNAALKDWRTHDGVDLSAQLGDPVAAAHAGTVIAVRDDVLLGKTVTMDLGDGLTACYGNLNEEVSVESGETLSAGDPIGTVGETAAGEHNDQPWLHFSLEQDGTAVDPLAYLSPTP